jgi:hypothetical protein
MFGHKITPEEIDRAGRLTGPSMMMQTGFRDRSLISPPVREDRAFVLVGQHPAVQKPPSVAATGHPLVGLPPISH